MQTQKGIVFNWQYWRNMSEINLYSITLPPKPNHFKGACHEIQVFGKQTFFKLANMVTFLTNLSSKVKKIADFYPVCKQLEKAMFILLSVL